MEHKKRRGKIWAFFWFAAVWLLLCYWMLRKSEISWKLLFLDICYGETESFVKAVMFSILILIPELLFAMVVYLFAKQKIKAVMRVRIYKFHKKIILGQFVEKHIQGISIVHIIVAICGILILNVPSFSRSANEWKGSETIAHAGGQIGKSIYTNSPEAIHKNYANGHRTFEIDMVLTSDNKLACIHDWDVDFQKGREVGIAPDSVEFLSYPIQGKYTPILFEDLCRIMNEYPDMWLVTDSKYNSGNEIRLEFHEMIRVAKELGMEHILERVVVQIYSESMYEIIMDIYPFHSWIFTLYQRWGGDIEEFHDIVRFCVKKDIQNITMPRKNLLPEIVDIADKYQIDIYTHTVNDVEDARECFKLGVKGIYTDSILPSISHFK